MRYRATLQMIDDEGRDCGSLESNVETSVSAAVKEVIRQLDTLVREQREPTAYAQTDPRDPDRRTR